jgi:hypothetical protein
VAESLHVDDALGAVLEPLLPARVSPRIGRPRVDDRIAFTAILFVLVTGVPWRMLPRELGCSGVTAWRRLREWHGGQLHDAGRSVPGQGLGDIRAGRHADCAHGAPQQRVARRTGARSVQARHLRRRMNGGARGASRRSELSSREPRRSTSTPAPEHLDARREQPALRACGRARRATSGS